MNTVKKKKLLLVEDLDDIRFVYTEMLSKDYEVITASTGNEALALLQKERPELMILDLHIPGLNGKEVYAKLRKEASFIELPVIFVSGSIFEVEETKTDKFVSMLFKPFRIAQLRAEISKFIP